MLRLKSICAAAVAVSDFLYKCSISTILEMPIRDLIRFSRRSYVIILASILITCYLLLALNYYARELFELYPRGQTVQPSKLSEGSISIEESEISTTTGKPQPTVSSSDVAHALNRPLRLDNTTARYYVRAILDPSDNFFPRLSCPVPASGRYDYLRAMTAPAITALPNALEHPKYFFALNLHQSVHLLPRLLGSIFETIQFLNPQNCVLSIVEGRSTDGTFEVLSTLGKEMERMGLKYFFKSSDINPKERDRDRISSLAELRNQALQPLMQNPGLYPSDSTIIFINDVSLCMEDILELIHQRVYQNADMTCAMDWIFEGTSFYDVWIGRTMVGDQFFEIPQSGSWEFAQNLFWNCPETRALQDAHFPYQVFSCWNGATAFTAKPLLEGLIKFRSNYPGECLMGEPIHFCKDLWHMGYGKIAVIPSVNVGYDELSHVKSRHGYVSDLVQQEKTGVGSMLIKWKRKPPELIKCVSSYQHPSWVPSDEALKQRDNMTSSHKGAWEDSGRIR
jgi:alpha-1,3-mannosyltransferase